VRSVIILFAKAPIAGRVKTRLQPYLTAAQAAGLHEAFVKDLLMRLQSFRDCDIELHTDIATDVWSATPVTHRLQESGGLELKMFHAAQNALASGYERAMIVGSDAPTLPAAHVRDLLAAREDVALGPTDDGGYYAISCRRVHREMFDRVEWSCESTRQQTVEALERAGLSVYIGPRWFDVDDPKDLARLMQEPDIPPNTAAWMRENFPEANRDR
jgi:rSAM/selenodomain-associated transferase 1